MKRTIEDDKDRVDAFRLPELGDATVIRAKYKHQRFAAHSHPTYVVGLITSGALKFRCEKETLVAPEGSICLINPGEVQTGEAAADNGWSYWSAYLPAELFSSVSEDLGLGTQAPFFATRIIEDPEALRTLEQFFKGVCAQSQTLAHKERSMEFIAVLLRRSHKIRESMPLKAEPYLVRTLKAYMAEHYSEAISLNELASVVDVTGYHLTRLFKATTGLALHAWLVQYRVERAHEMLMHGIAPVDAATRCGFSDQPHMARWIRRISGMTPREIQTMSRTFKK